MDLVFTLRGKGFRRMQQVLSLGRNTATSNSDLQPGMGNVAVRPAVKAESTDLAPTLQNAWMDKICEKVT